MIEPSCRNITGRALKRWRDRTATFQSRGSSGEKTTLSADARQRLQALGYVASSADPGARAALGPRTSTLRLLGSYASLEPG